MYRIRWEKNRIRLTVKVDRKQGVNEIESRYHLGTIGEETVNFFLKQVHLDCTP